MRSSRDPAVLVGPMREALRRIDPELAPFNVRRLDDVVSDALAPQRFSKTLLAAFGSAGQDGFEPTAPRGTRPQFGDHRREPKPWTTDHVRARLSMAHDHASSVEA